MIHNGKRRFVPLVALLVLTLGGGPSVAALAVEPPLAAEATRASRSTYEAVEAGKALLEAKLSELSAAGQAVWTAAESPSWARVYVASWNRRTDALRLTLINKSGRQVQLLEGADPIPSVTYSKQLHSRYAYAGGDELVVGVLYPNAAEADGGYRVEYAYYVPMAAELYAPDVIAAGSDYLSGVIRDAYAELDRLGVKSVAFRDRPITGVIDPLLLKAIVIIEHSSHVKLLSDFEPEKEMGEFLAYLGLNGQAAFGEAMSSAGALGLAQFIPSTYALFVKNRPELRLAADFSAGMADHVNAIKAAAAYLDSALAELPREVRDLYLVNRQAAAPYLAGAYNGGSTRVRWAIEEWGMDGWASQHQMSAAEAQAKYQEWRSEVNRLEPLRLGTTDPTLRAKYETQFWEAVSARESYKAQILPLSKASLRSETVFYVKKLDTVYQMLVGGYYATPTAPGGELPAVVAPTPSPEPAAASNGTPLGDIVICFDGDPC
jgi:hypothetical protein